MTVRSVLSFLVIFVLATTSVWADIMPTYGIDNTLLRPGISTVLADLTPSHGIGKTLRPRGDTMISMVSETVDVEIDANVARVWCTFDFLNEGPPDTLEVGFPRGRNEQEIYLDNGDLNDFEVRTSSARPLPVSRSRLDPYVNDPSGILVTSWFTCTIPFDSTGTVQKVFVEYWTTLLPGKPVYSDLLFKYILTTGSFWRGPIGEAVVTVRLTNVEPDQLSVIKPSGYILNGAEISWRFTDFEPAEDIELHIMQDAVYDRVKEANRLLRENPDSARGHFLRGTILFNQTYGDYSCAESLREFELAVAADPQCWDARWFLAIQYYQQSGRRREQLEAIVAGNPDYRCTDEAYQVMYPHHRSHFPNTASEWLDKIKTGRWP